MARQQNKRMTNRVRNLVIVTAMSAVVLTVSTYAWFIGMQTVNVSSFDVEIASTESLLLSLDGATWDTTINISQDVLDDVSYVGHTNSWGGAGLVPVSSVGDIDLTASRLIMFEKASLTANEGGYRLMSSQVGNTAATETDGYVAFDLFIKNLSGTEYITEYNELNEEAIYLTTDSEVKVATGGVEDTGIENSVRVAFAQIARVPATETDDAVITAMDCEDTIGTANLTNTDQIGICRTAQIWEPNDIDHEANAIAWYNESCQSRTDVTTYENACSAVADASAYATYAIRKAITDVSAVNVYDGADYNGYVSTSTGADPYLYAYPYFTDTQKDLTGVNRPQFMTLAPNSITKVRVYIYIEGQDVDNYDFASIGKQIAVNFGFTKERFTETDVSHTGNSTIAPSLLVPSTSIPLELTVAEVEDAGYDIIALSGITATYAEYNGVSGLYEVYTGTDGITVTSDLVVGVAGTYTVDFEVTDDRDYKASTTMLVTVS